MPKDSRGRKTTISELQRLAEVIFLLLTAEGRTTWLEAAQAYYGRRKVTKGEIGEVFKRRCGIMKKLREMNMSCQLVSRHYFDKTCWERELDFHEGVMCLPGGHRTSHGIRVSTEGDMIYSAMVHHLNQKAVGTVKFTAAINVEAQAHGRLVSGAFEENRQLDLFLRGDRLLPPKA